MKNKRVFFSALSLCALLIYACGGGGGGAATGDTTAPTVPSTPFAEAVSSRRIDISWLPSVDDVGVTGYNVFRNGLYVTSVKGTSFSDTNLAPKTQYCYMISAYDAAGNESSQSVEVCAVTHIAWAKSFDGSTGFIQSIRRTSDGGYVGAGVAYPTGQFYTDMMVIRLGADGDVTWQKTYGGPYEDLANSVEETSDGGFIVAGHRVTSYDLLYPTDLWLLKLDTNGNVVWQKSYNVSLWNVASSVHQTPDGGFVVAGYTGDQGPLSYDFWVLKLDGTGNIEWQKRYGGASWEQATSIEPTSDGGFIVTGDTYSFGAPGFGDIWVLKLDGSGNVTWQKAYGDSTIEYQAFEIRQTSDAGYILAGYKGQDFLAMKLDGNGNIVWQKTYGGPGWEEAYSVDETHDGNYFLAGRTDSFGAGNGDMWLVRLNANGEILWQKTYGGTSWDLAHSVRETPDAGCVLAGLGAGSNPMVLKLDLNGEIGASCLTIGTSNAISVNIALVPIISNATPTDTNATVTNTSILSQDVSPAVSQICPGP